MIAALPFVLNVAVAATPSDDPRSVVRVHDTSTCPFLLTHEGRTFGDPFPTYWDGVWHLYTLSADLRQVFHFTSKDLVKWAEHKPAMVGTGIATGSVVRRDGKYYLFYTDAGPQTIRLVVSDNPWQFDFKKSRLVAQADNKVYQLHKKKFRDCYVFFNDVERRWWMLIEATSDDKVAVGLFTSEDLLSWEQRDPIFKDGSRAHASCPQVFEYDGIWYLAIQDMGNWYYSAPTPRGPWTSRGQYLSLVVEAASRFASDGTRQLTWGWLCDWIAKPKPKALSYGGPLSVGREIVFNADGSMGVRPFPELLDAIRTMPGQGDLLAVARKLSGEWQVDAGKQTLKCTTDRGGAIVLDLPGESPDYYFEADLELDSPNAAVNVIVRSSVTAERGYGVALSPADKKIAIHRLAAGGERHLLNDKPYGYPDKNTVSLQIFVCDDHLEAFLDGRECLSAQVVDRSEHRLAIEITSGSGTIRKPFLHHFRSGSGSAATVKAKRPNP